MSEHRTMDEGTFPDERPADKAFGEAAAEKAELVDDAEESGGTDRLVDAPEGTAPRAAGKAEPDSPT